MHSFRATNGQLTSRAVWTRFHPIAYAVQDVLKSGRLGKVHRMFADFSMNFEPDSEFSSDVLRSVHFRHRSFSSVSLGFMS